MVEIPSVMVETLALLFDIVDVRKPLRDSNFSALYLKKRPRQLPHPSEFIVHNRPPPPLRRHKTYAVEKACLNKTGKQTTRLTLEIVGYSER